MPASPLAPARGRWLVPALIVVVSLTVGGGLLAREVYRKPDAAADTGVIATRTSQSLAPEQQPGSPVVEMTPDAAAHPHADGVRALLQNYFDAINARNYELWKTTVTKLRAQAKSKVEWEADYRSTKDGSILVYRIEAMGDGTLQSLIGFTSTQDPQDGPVDLQEPCVRWHLTLPMVLENGMWKLDAIPAGTTPMHERCT
ncbi:hypothetical protein [Amycolatopsis magusensis]|uniref:Mce-associated membrane protein n=1 Tax=Amycolatopsis magusensis TaxID=882444 RepID=A0ABS4Q5H6_9PSEU|nr:hypothetical protein [Amycolatopsis magusensis]MBP2186353.1 hypothetical protein [Amycolatopsis magusensis]MDI5974797.1 hypothetical protein [Amycolatopsis magusensis]